MAIYGSDSRDRVRDAVDFIALVSARTELRRAGPARYEGLCPFHDERTPSFGIDPVRKLYHCFGCGASGDVFTFVQETEGVDFKGALELLADRYGIELEAERESPGAAARRRERERLLELLERTAAYYERCLWESGEGAAAREYLASRDLREETLRELRVGFAPPAWDRVLRASRRHGYSERELLAAGLIQRSAGSAGHVDRFRERIMFPLADLRGRVVGFGARALRADQGPKYLNSAESDLYHKGRLLYAAHLARPHAARAGEVIVCEGYTDVIALHQAGLRNTVGLMGTAMTPAQVAELGRLGSRVLLALDADSAGQEAMLRAARLAGDRRLELRVVRMPEDEHNQGIDPAELVRTRGAEAMQEAVREAIPFMRFRVERVLALGDHSSASGRDRMLEELRALLGSMPPSAMRMSLLRLVCGRLALPESLAESLLAGASGRVPHTPRGAGGPAARAGRAGAAREGPAARRERIAAGTGGGAGAISRRERLERAFLALCIAHPAQGAPALADIVPAQHFTGEPLRAAAERLREGDLSDPLAGLDGGEPLGRLLTELVAQAVALSPPRGEGEAEGEAEAAMARERRGAAELEVQRLQLELALLEREIQAARGRGIEASAGASPAPGPAPASAGEAAGEGASPVSELAARREEVRRAFDRAQQRALDAASGVSA